MLGSLQINFSASKGFEILLQQAARQVDCLGFVKLAFYFIIMDLCSSCLYSGSLVSSCALPSGNFSYTAQFSPVLSRDTILYESVWQLLECLLSSQSSATIVFQSCIVSLPVQPNSQPTTKGNFMRFGDFFFESSLFSLILYSAYLIIVLLIKQTLAEVPPSLDNATVSYFLQNLQQFVTREDKFNISATQPVPQKKFSFYFLNFVLVSF